MSPVDHVLAARPRVQRRKKIKRRWRRCTVSIILFFLLVPTRNKKRLFPLPSLSVRDKGKEEKKNRYGGRVSTPLDELQYASGRDSGYRRAQYRLVGFTVVCIHVPPSQRGR